MVQNSDYQVKELLNAHVWNPFAHYLFYTIFLSDYFLSVL